MRSEVFLLVYTADTAVTAVEMVLHSEMLTTYVCWPCCLPPTSATPAQVLEHPPRRQVQGDQQDHRPQGHSSQRADHGVRQRERQQRHGRAVHAQPRQRHQRAVRRVPDQRAGRGRGGGYQVGCCCCCCVPATAAMCYIWPKAASLLHIRGGLLCPCATQLLERACTYLVHPALLLVPTTCKTASATTSLLLLL
jgi:hypothetical protein